jgi:hypothetical protein
VGVCGYVLLCLALNDATSRGIGSRGTYPVLETPRRGYQGLRCVPSRVTKRSYSGLTGGEIMSILSHRDGRKDRCELGLSLVLFRLAVPPLQPGAVGPYLVRGAWLPSRLLLEGVKSYLVFLRCNQWPEVLRYLRYQTLTTVVD